MEKKKSIFNFGVVEETAHIQVIKTSPRAIVNVVRAEAQLKNIIDKCSCTAEDENGKEVKEYSTYRFESEDLKTIDEVILPILSDLVAGFEE